MIHALFGLQAGQTDQGLCVSVCVCVCVCECGPLLSSVSVMNTNTQVCAGVVPSRLTRCLLAAGQTLHAGPVRDEEELNVN